MRSVCVAAICAFAIACGGSSNSVAANPCATKGATYFVSETELSGNCGPVPSSVFNVNPDGTITTGTNETCGSISVQGCTLNKNSCTYTSQGYSITYTSSVTFSSDGTTASGLDTTSASGGGQSCTSTYTLSAVRQ
jgi:hypothetical protein